MGLWERLFGKKPQKKPDPSISNTMRMFVAGKVKEGFVDEEQIVRTTAEIVQDEHGRDDLEPEIRSVVAELMSSHREQQRSWAGPTDCDKIEAVFAELEEQGIVARQNFTCCQTCGSSEIWAEIGRAQSQRRVLGYVFYHQQDTERAAEAGYLFLSYGSVEKGDESSLVVARNVVDALRKAGLAAEWDGSIKTRILVTGLDWRKRR